MSWDSLVRAAQHMLADAGVPAGPDARLIAEEAAGRDFRLIGAEEPNEDQRERFEKMVARRARREPLQHVLGKMWFRYLELESRPGVFVVRPETEMVVQAGLDAVAGLPAPRIVDLCTGSGAIAISLATELATSAVWAVEKSSDAFASASRNNMCYGNRVQLLQGDALSARELLAPSLADGPFDLVISNPPYVPAPHKLAPEAAADPAMALWGGGVDGLEFPLALIEEASGLLGNGGILVMEHASEQSVALAGAAREAGFDAETRQDLTGRDRFLYAVKKEK
ncbi:release factor glutamine methyltransferase [Arcanobacterium wilhelmae]|uniref:peptide chain release factor N(5)-glutamine methyltransferase n=1 Tax=Arcanobacterium wilhelmae TaxID=1803177 RepID=A0ABT9N9W1_9ACTO|nr:peptide chain release factor N(5)-glutamine methyltransferase [Arcanobacterium wilhelmae]MDP9800512.1 release factor glutamine methyltransferase [Arcanobacterium wilhelmae]WFN89930.1 peptide chain release factor N(5)-glutamine methyltransferase [Arcanobacterium wilhelmae]